MRVYYDRDADLNLIKGKKGRHHRLRLPGAGDALNLKESGVKNMAVGFAEGRLGDRQEGRGRWSQGDDCCRGGRVVPI